jgi:hypothetical protein
VFSSFGTKQYNALTLTDAQQKSITVTHPFSPHKGKRFELIKKTRKGGKDRLICHDDAGNTMWFLADWTDYHDTGSINKATNDPHSPSEDFRNTDLEMLSKLLDELEEV